MVKEIVEKHIEGCLKDFVRCIEEHNEDYHSRIDELFLLWKEIDDCSFVKACEYFDINYEDFNSHNHNKIKNQIVNKFKEYFERLEGGY